MYNSDEFKDFLELDIVSLVPPEIGKYILSFLNPRQVAKCSGTSKRWRELCNASYIWKRFCIKEQWSNLDMVHNFKSHFPACLLEINKCDLEDKCDWRINYERHINLPMNWQKNKSIRYRLTDSREATVNCLDSDGIRLVLGRMDGSVTLLNIERLPFYIKDFNCLLDSKIFNIKMSGDFCVVQQFSLLQFYSLSTGFKDAKCFDMGFGLIELIQRTKWKPNRVKDKYKPGKLKDIFFEIYQDLVYVTVRDFQCVYVWNINGKRVDTIHVNNSRCKMRSMLIYKEKIFVIYASRNIRHVTAYDLKSKNWIFEVTTPLCKTQKLLPADTLLVGIAIAGPGLTCIGVLTVWDINNGIILSEKHTPEYLCHQTVVTAYELIIYAETTSINIWEPRSDCIWRKVSTFGNPVYLKTLPFSFLGVYTDKYAYVWDWYAGNKCFRLFSKYNAEDGNFIYANDSTIILKSEDDHVDMLGFS